MFRAANQTSKKILHLDFVVQVFWLKMINVHVRNSFPLLLQMRFLQSFSAVSPITSSFTVHFLVNSCGLSLKSAVSASKKFELDEKNLHKPLAVLEFFKSHGFSDTHLAQLIKKHPWVLHCRLKTNLMPKFDFFIKNGFVGQLLQDLLIAKPQLLHVSLDSHIKPSIEFLRCHIDSNDKIVVASKRSPWLLLYDLEAKMKPNIEFLLKEGVLAKGISKMIVMQPSAVSASHDRMVHALNVVKNLGLQPEAPNFVDALRVILSVKESVWRKKIEAMKSLGWTEEEILLAFKRIPHCLACSEEKLRSRLNLYAEHFNWGPQNIFTTPVLLKYSIDKRILPRINVLKVLESKKLIKRDKKIAWWLHIKNEEFLKKCIMKYIDEVPDLLKVYLEQTRQKI